MWKFLLFIAIIFVIAYPWLIPLAILLVVIFYFINKAVDNSSFGKKQKIKKNKRIIEHAKELQENMNSRGVFPTYSITSDIASIYFDENNRTIYFDGTVRINGKTFAGIALDVDSIISYEINNVEKNNIQYTMGTYFNGKFKVNNDIKVIWFSIHLNSIDEPYIDLLCSSFNLPINEAIKFVNQINGAFDYMMMNKETTEQKPLLNLIPDLETELIEDNKKQ